MPVQCTCAACGAVFNRDPGRAADRRYCSLACYRSRPQQAVPRTCRLCGTAFLAWPSAVRKGAGNYCSSACYRSRPQRGRKNIEHAETTLICAHCKTPFVVWRGRQHAAKYCSQRCVGEARRGMTFDRPSRTRHGTAYQEWRLAVYQRDDFTCRDCGKRSKRLNAHHIEDWDSAPTLRFDLANGVTLCVICHGKRHSPKGKKVGTR